MAGDTLLPAAHLGLKMLQLSSVVLTRCPRPVGPYLHTPDINFFFFYFLILNQNNVYTFMSCCHILKDNYFIEIEWGCLKANSCM